MSRRWDARYRSVELILCEERLGAAEELQVRKARGQQVPNTKNLPLRQMRRLLEIFGALVIGVAVSSFSLLFCFVFFNMVLHVSL